MPTVIITAAAMMPTKKEGMANPKREKIVIKPLAGDAGLWATITPVKTPMTTAMSMAVRTRSAVAQIFSRINSMTGFPDINHGWVTRGEVEEGKV